MTTRSSDFTNQEVENVLFALLAHETDGLREDDLDRLAERFLALAAAARTQWGLCKLVLNGRVALRWDEEIGDWRYRTIERGARDGQPGA
jgi:hypothetical protein